ncbi:MAG: hypothetical protein ACXV9P_03190 [Acidimicrobiia bacterium]
MTLPSAVTSHHTAWMNGPGAVPHPVRYAVDGDRLVCFGDEFLSNVDEGARVSVVIHEIAGGQRVAAFSASLHQLLPESVTTNALVELLEHVALGRTLDEVEAHLAEERSHRRIVAIVP